MLGPAYVLVRRTSRGFRSVDREAASTLQKCLLGAGSDQDWLFRQCQHIADVLDKGEVALAQIYGLSIPIDELDDRQLKRIALVCFAKAGFNADEPRIPEGDSRGGEWTADDDGGGAAPSRSPTSATGAGSPLPANQARSDNRQQLAGGVGDITFGHGARHVHDPDAVEAAIRDALAITPLSPGFNSGAVNVNGTWYQYRAYLRPNGGIYVGTYFPW